MHHRRRTGWTIVQAASLLLAMPPLTAAAADGAALFAANCAACHGARGAGQPRWWEANPAGRLPAPPLDADGHAWQHADAELLRFMAEGMAGVAGPEDRSDMPAFGDRLTAADRAAILDFVKTLWPPGTRAAQAALNPDGSGIVAALLGETGDWTFPPDCLSPMERAAAAQPPRSSLSRGGR